MDKLKRDKLEKEKKQKKHQIDMQERIESGSCRLDWKDWRWQIKHRITDINTVEKLLNIRFKATERKQILKTIKKFPISITPYYLSLINAKKFRTDPIFRQAVPNPSELIVVEHESSDPLSEDKDSPVPGITHRYPDRVLFLISNTCSMYCRHCTRKRKVGDVDSIPSKEQILEGIEYIKRSPQVRDVLLSGGDPLMLSDEYLDWILTELRKIEHVEIIRIGTRMPVVLPFRITDELVEMLRKHHPLYINTHFNHPRELTKSSKNALIKLADAGIPLGNQTVLLSGVNDCPRIMKTLFQKLVKNRVKPYYLFQCDLSEGLAHFRTPISKGIEIMENLIGHTSGLAVPRYVVDAPGGAGKIPLMPKYLISWGTHKAILRNYEGVITSYKEPDSYPQTFCKRNCKECKISLKLNEASEIKSSGIAKLLSYGEKKTSLIPRSNSRLNKR